MKTPLDQNHVPAILAVLNTDAVQGTNLVTISIDAAGDISTDSVATISFTPSPIDPQDENYNNCWLFEGSDGLTYPAVATANGSLLIEE